MRRHIALAPRAGTRRHDALHAQGSTTSTPEPQQQPANTRAPASTQSSSAFAGVCTSAMRPSTPLFS